MIIWLITLNTFSVIDVGYGRQLVSTENTTSDHTVVSKPDYLYGPQVVAVIMRKPGKNYTID